MWLPRQHGAWGMLIIPPMMGMILGGWTWAYLPVLVSWWMGYLAFWSWGAWVSSRSPKRRALAIIPLMAYSSLAGTIGLITLLIVPSLWTWAPVFLPLIGIAAWQQWTGHERSLTSGITTTLAASIMLATVFSVSLRHHGDSWWLASPLGAFHPHASPVSNNAGTLHGWAWVWCVTALLAAYFVGTVPYVKSMIRQRGNTRLMTGSLLFHTLVACLVWGGVFTHRLGWQAGIVFTVLALRAGILPIKQASALAKNQGMIKPRFVGLTEVLLSLLVMASLLTS